MYYCGWHEHQTLRREARCFRVHFRGSINVLNKGFQRFLTRAVKGQTQLTSKGFVRIRVNSIQSSQDSNLPSPPPTALLKTVSGRCCLDSGPGVVPPMPWLERPDRDRVSARCSSVSRSDCFALGFDCSILLRWVPPWETNRSTSCCLGCLSTPMRTSKTPAGSAGGGLGEKLSLCCE